jgi:signal transduction histidine kinase
MDQPMYPQNTPAPTDFMKNPILVLASIGFIWVLSVFVKLASPVLSITLWLIEYLLVFSCFAWLFKPQLEEAWGYVKLHYIVPHLHRRAANSNSAQIH